MTPMQQDRKQRKLSRFLFHDLKEAGCEIKPFETDQEHSEEDVERHPNHHCWDFERAAENLRRLNDSKHVGHSNDDNDKLKKLRLDAVTMLEENFGFTGISRREKKAAEPGKKALQHLGKVLQAAATNKCWVFDLLSTEPGRDNFNGALLKCLLNGIQTAGKESKESLWKKLKYTMLWDRWVRRVRFCVSRLCQADRRGGLQKLGPAASSERHASLSLVSRGM